LLRRKPWSKDENDLFDLGEESYEEEYMMELITYSSLLHHQSGRVKE
jgi:hypothetical protein